MVDKQLLNKENKNRWTTYTLLKDENADSAGEEKMDFTDNVTDGTNNVTNKKYGGQKGGRRTAISSEKNTKSSEKAKESSEKMLGLIRQKPTISAAEIAMLIGMSSRGVEKHIRKLREAGFLKRIGADKGGYWEIIQ